ncbi:MAG TPA: hypothetical protein VGO65_12770 [Pseudolysinimonas sp.]|jgi:hypothetical protein|nr:hypothetical protein [Pseudolysinimonas sp.]
MKRILYGGGSFQTDDAVADALMDYANVLAVIDSADVVRLPGLDEDGTVRQIQMLIGPSSQILAMATDAESVEMGADDAVAELRGRAATRLPSSTSVGDSGELTAQSDAESTSHAN